MRLQFENILKKVDQKVLTLLLFLAVFLSLIQSYQVGYVFDDSHSVQKNLAIQSNSLTHSFEQLGQIWTNVKTSSILPENRIYRPMTFTFYSFAWLLGGGQPWAFHIFKVLAHFIFCWMFFLCWQILYQKLLPQYQSKTTTLLAWVTALFLAVHPATVECSTYIAASTSLWAAMFYSVGYYFFLRAIVNKKANKKTLLSLFFFVAAFFSKEEAITFPAIILASYILVYPELLRKPAWYSSSKKILLYTLTAVSLGLVFYFHRNPDLVRSQGNVPPLEYFMTQWRAYLWYIKTVFWPVDLNADNLVFGFSHSIRELPVIRALGLNLLLVAFAIWSRKLYPTLLFGLAWFYITLSPASSIIPLSEPINEHRMYLAYFGLIGGIAPVIYSWWISLRQQLPRPQKLGAILLTTLFVILFTCTLQRVHIWTDEELLWRDTIAKNPESGRAYNNLANILMARSKYPDALAALNQCEKFWTQYVYCPVNKGIIYQVLNRPAEAKISFEKAIQLDPLNIYANFYLAKYYYEIEKNSSLAAPYFLKTLSLTNGQFPEAQRYLELIKNQKSL